MYRSATTHSENPNRQNFRVWNSHRERGHIRRDIFGGSVLQLYRAQYAVRSALLETATLLGVGYLQLHVIQCACGEWRRQLCVNRKAKWRPRLALCNTLYLSGRGASQRFLARDSI